MDRGLRQPGRYAVAAIRYRRDRATTRTPQEKAVTATVAGILPLATLELPKFLVDSELFAPISRP